MSEKSLTIRKKKDGTTTIDGTLPKNHVFSARFLDREIQTGLVNMTINLLTGDGVVTYEVTGWEVEQDDVTGEDRVNFTGIKATLKEGGNG